MSSTQPTASAVMDDVHRHRDTRQLPIDRVGIKDIRHPLNILGRDGQAQGTVALFSLTVDLPHHQKGTHMSRFVELLNDSVTQLDPRTFGELTAGMAQRLEAEHGAWQASFPYFIRKHAPVSGVASWLDYQVTLSSHGGPHGSQELIQVVIPVTSLCPCSKKISDYGAHNQRSHATVTLTPAAPLWIEDIVDLVEQEASCELYGLLKRADEKYVTERAYNNPKFVEDMVRDVAARLYADARIGYFKVETENFESIHNHSAYAMIERRDF